MAKYCIERLRRGHKKSGFDCGKPELNTYLETLANQHVKKYVSQTYVATLKGEDRVLGYYSLASTAVDPTVIPPALARRLPRHFPAPGALLARLAVESALHGQGLGGRLLFSAMRRVLLVADQVGCHFFVVDAMDDEARAFYARHQFVSLLDDPNHMVLPMSEVKRAVPK